MSPLTPPLITVLILSTLESTAKNRSLTPVLARIRRGRPPSARMRKRASVHRTRQTLARHLSTGELEVDRKMKSSQKSLYQTPAHKGEKCGSVGRLERPSIRSEMVRALGSWWGVHCARADLGQVFRPDSAHLERAAEELEA